MFDQPAENVRVVVSEPWELGERVFTGRIVRSQAEPDERLLVALNQPFVHAGVTYSSLLLSPRHEGHPLSLVEAGEAVPCNARALASASAVDRDGMEARDWRGGGLVLIGTLSSDR